MTTSQRRRQFLMACLVLTLFAGTAAAQDRYVAAIENDTDELVITTASGASIVVPKSDQTWADEKTVGVGDIAVSRDGSAVGWVDYYRNCCTSYAVPIYLEVYRGGKRHIFDPAIAPYAWCFVDGTASVAAVSTTVHGPQNEVIELWDVETGKRLDEYTWMEDESNADAPAWAVAAHKRPDTNECTTK